MRGFKDKYILRLLGERYLPKEVAWRPKGMFRAPLDSFWGKIVPSILQNPIIPNVAEGALAGMLSSQFSVPAGSLIEDPALWFAGIFDMR